MVTLVKTLAMDKDHWWQRLLHHVNCARPTAYRKWCVSTECADLLQPRSYLDIGKVEFPGSSSILVNSNAGISARRGQASDRHRDDQGFSCEHVDGTAVATDIPSEIDQRPGNDARHAGNWVILRPYAGLNSPSHFTVLPEQATAEHETLRWRRYF